MTDDEAPIRPFFDQLDNLSNIAWLLLFLVVAGGAWFLWGKFGFQYTHDNVTAYANTKAAAQPASAAAKSGADVAAEIGQSGDAYGGANALFAALVAAFAAWAGMLQYKALTRAQEAYRDERDENRLEREQRKREQFESLFFQLLHLVREVGQQVSTQPRRSPLAIAKNQGPPLPKYGSAALNAFAHTIHNKTLSYTKSSDPPVPKVLVYHFNEIYNRRPSSLGLYFCMLHQLMELISQSDFTKDPREKAKYSDIARAQMSEGEVFMLALYGMSARGHHFLRYIEEFGLLQHLLPIYEKFYKKYLDEGYSPRAFLSGDARFAARLKITPDFPADYFEYTPEQAAVVFATANDDFDDVGDDRAQ